MKRLLLPLALAAALTVPVGAQFGWFQLNGGLIARLSSSETAATIRQDGSGAILDLYAGATRVWRATSTGITNSVAALFADGTAAAPSIAFTSESDFGLYRSGTRSLHLVGAGGTHLLSLGSSTSLKSDGEFRWSSTGQSNGTADLILARDAAGIASLNHSLRYTGVLFAALGAPTNGTVTYCSDCTPNVSPCTGAGTGAIAKRLNAAWDCR